jgi:hypothetical protein
MVEVFKSNVKSENEAEQLLLQFRKDFPACKATFDLEDCDKVFRVVGERVVSDQILRFAERNQIRMEILN